MKSALEGGSSRKKSITEGGTSRKKHECPICHQLGHHWYTYKNGNPQDVAAMEAERYTSYNLVTFININYLTNFLTCPLQGSTKEKAEESSQL